MVYHSPMKIGALSKATGVSIDTIRYYEQRQLLPSAARTASGYRQYSSDDVTRLKFIVEAKELGFTLKEISQLLGAQSNDCLQVKLVAQSKAEEIDARIIKLSQMKDVLLDLVDQCNQSAGDDPCPILTSLKDLT
jgi:DNA-binding transcriptional MerR regulator